MGGEIKNQKNNQEMAAGYFQDIFISLVNKFIHNVLYIKFIS